jgi:hypothetical protein
MSASRSKLIFMFEFVIVKENGTLYLALYIQHSFEEEISCPDGSSPSETVVSTTKIRRRRYA